MGAGVGVKVSVRDYGPVEVVKKGLSHDLRITVGTSILEAYTWSMKCTKSGYIVMENIEKVLKENDWLKDVWVSGSLETPQVKKVDFSLMTAEISEPTDLHFVIGGGYIQNDLKRGDTYDLDSPYGYELCITVNVPAELEDGTKATVHYELYPQTMVFHHSDQFVEIFNWCWDHWSDDGMDTDEWDVNEEYLNDPYAYNAEGFAQFNKKREKFLSKTIFGKKKKSKSPPEPYPVKRQMIPATEPVRCPECNSSKIQIEQSYSRIPGQYPRAIRRDTYYCANCDCYFHTPGMKNETYLNLPNRKSEPIAACALTNTMGVSIYDIEYGIDDKVVWGWGDGKKYRSKIRSDGDRDYFNAGKMKIYLDECMRII